MDPIERQSSKKHVVWDEENLAENEKIQAEFANISVPEPKTPYHGPSSPGDDLEDEMRPLALGEEEGPRAKMSAFDYFLTNGAGDSAPLGGSPADDAGPSTSGRGRARSDSGGFSSGKRPERSQSEGLSITNSDCSGGRSVEKRQRFEAARRKHYNMGEALRLGRVLASASEDGSQERVSGGDEELRDGAEDEDEHMQDCGSSRLQETHANGHHQDGLEGAAEPSGSSGGRRQRKLTFSEPHARDGGTDGEGGEEEGDAEDDDQCNADDAGTPAGGGGADGVSGQ